MHTIKLQVDDTIYNEIVQSGINIQDELKLALTKLISKKDSYIHSQEYKEDKNYFNNALESIESGSEQLVSHDDVWEQIEEHTKAN